MVMEKRFLTPRELAEYLGIARGTIYNWLSEKKIPCFKLGRLVKFDLREIDKWLKGKSIDPYEY